MLETFYGGLQEGIIIFVDNLQLVSVGFSEIFDNLDAREMGASEK